MALQMSEVYGRFKSSKKMVLCFCDSRVLSSFDPCSPSLRGENSHSSLSKCRPHGSWQAAVMMIFPGNRKVRTLSRCAARVVVVVGTFLRK